jgi:hypothetical protein
MPGRGRRSTTSSKNLPGRQVGNLVIETLAGADEVAKVSLRILQRHEGCSVALKRSRKPFVLQFRSDERRCSLRIVSSKCASPSLPTPRIALASTSAAMRHRESGCKSSSDLVRSSNLIPVVAGQHKSALEAPTWGLK